MKQRWRAPGSLRTATATGPDRHFALNQLLPGRRGRSPSPGGAEGQGETGPQAERGGEGSGWNVPGGPRRPRPHTLGRGLSAPGSLAAWEPPKSCSGRAERAPGRHSPPGRPAGAPGRLRLVVAELDTQPPATS